MYPSVNRPSNLQCGCDHLNSSGVVWFDCFQEHHGASPGQDTCRLGTFLRFEVKRFVHP